MTRKITVLTLSAMLFALCFSAEAQQTKKIPLIGYLSATSLSVIARRTEAFRQSLRELGFVEGKNIVIEWRSSGDKGYRVSGGNRNCTHAYLTIGEEYERSRYRL